MTTTWRLLGGVGLISVMLGLGCNGNSLGGGTDPNCPDPNNCQNPNPVAEFSSLNVMPNQVTLDSQDGAKTTQQFVVTGVRADGSMTGPLQAVFNMAANGIGTLDANSGLFTATVALVRDHRPRGERDERRRDEQATQARHATAPSALSART